jgi:uncharacterized membrane protein YkoI
MKTPQQLWHPGTCIALCGALFVGCAGPAFAGSTDATAAPLPAGAKITSEQASAIALKAMPGKVTGVTVEKKLGKNVYVVEIMSESQGEKDVFVDLVSGKVIGTD